MVLCDDYPYPIYIEEANVKFVLLCSLRLCRNIPKYNSLVQVQYEQINRISLQYLYRFIA